MGQTITMPKVSSIREMWDDLNYPGNENSHEYQLFMLGAEALFKIIEVQVSKLPDAEACLALAEIDNEIQTHLNG